jgi:pimeloyl-ACP methyl ester carboxylesterase
VAVACLGVLASAAGGAPKQPLPTFPRISSLCHRADFSSGGHRVRAALCRPAGSARMPAVVVLHGCGGFGGIDEVLARDLPSHGVATYYIDYFGLTPEPSKRGFCGSPRIETSFATWQRIVVDATNALKRMPSIDPARVGAIGWSLGGGLALVTGEYGAGTTPLRHSPFHALVVLSAFDDSGQVGYCRRRSCFRAEAETLFPSATRGRSTGRCEPRMSQPCCTSIRTGRTSGRADSGSQASSGPSIFCAATSSSSSVLSTYRASACRHPR